jgi:hypothetical protein
VNFRLPLPTQYYYYVLALKETRLAEWVRSWADVGFTDLRCDFLDAEDDCPYDSTYFSVDNSTASQGTVVPEYKYTVVLDGNGGDNGQLLQALKSGSVVLRASVYRTWADKRLMPWVHYMPVDNTFLDIYAIMDFFVGASPNNTSISNATERPTRKQKRREEWVGMKSNSYDTEAHAIARNAKSWAAKALRREDLLLYVYRLILEYARVIDDARESLGWVEDLKQS